MNKDKFDDIFKKLKDQSNEAKKQEEDLIKKLDDESEIRINKQHNILIPIQHELAEDILKIKTKISEISEFIEVYASFLEKRTPIPSYVLSITYSAILDQPVFGVKHFNPDKEEIWIFLELYGDTDKPQLVLRNTMDGEKMRLDYTQATGGKILEDYFERIAKWLLDHRLTFKKI